MLSGRWAYVIGYDSSCCPPVSWPLHYSHGEMFLLLAMMSHAQFDKKWGIPRQRACGKSANCGRFARVGSKDQAMSAGKGQCLTNGKLTYMW